mmetsp:Transcript_2989/g.3539  ORF Transcript_2989/g.3539 Transcript_2989/m.3539 type:complete len:255 (+) Transcript_2989:46-810(+)|eukprot:CAMPEP_0205827262 /NCGR_PEP_ID=MMETSP0206-20130828/31409_1 /ASSEMBLY_ACC=CAM_ASM_000279 /TAXON_ID=36767 /ORGANISM="Euplotes focardii, Strain TN1" /LENGTH=254 /DNA_ID=CAMNT_0053128003 /DNA_START=40 /DNA_END=804 /DNA_ORIENTATION=+
MNKAVLLLAVVALCFVGAAQADCIGKNGVPRVPESVDATSMASCCWLADDQCCSLNGAVTNLTDIQVSLDQLVDRGVSEECYFSLADLECSACGPNQLSYIQWDGPADDDDGYDDDDNDDADDDEDFFDQRYTFRLCPRFCDQVFSGCKGDALLLGADASGTATTFCESIQGSVLTADKNDVSGIFLNTNFVVSDFDCYAGAPIEDVEAGVGVCLDDFTAVKFRPVYPDESSSSASAMVISSVLAIAAILALVL